MIRENFSKRKFSPIHPFSQTTSVPVQTQRRMFELWLGREKERERETVLVKRAKLEVSYFFPISYGHPTVPNPNIQS